MGFFIDPISRNGLEYLMTSNNKTKLICLNNKTIVAELNPGELYNLLDNDITIKLLDSTGDFFVEIADNCQKSILINDNKIYDAAQGKSGDHITVEKNEYVIIADEQAFLSRNVMDENTKKTVDDLKIKFETKENRKKRGQLLLASLMSLFFFLILLYQFFSLNKPHELISEELPPNLANYQYLNEAQLAKIKKDNNLITVDDDIEESFDEKTDTKQKTKTKTKTAKKRKKQTKKLINLTELNKLKDNYLNQATSGTLTILNKIGSAFNKHLKHIKEIETKPQLSVFWKSWNLGMIAQISTIAEKSQLQAKAILSSFTKYKAFLDDEALTHKKEYEKSIQKKIDSILILSELNPNKARLSLQKLKEWVPTENYLYQNIIQQINYLK